MKKLRHISFLISCCSFLILMSACTLSMEEWVETEEQKGYEDVETVENDFYTLKYEYKATTRSLTDDIQKYIAQVEDDSIIYFMDNTPSEWLPKTGGQVVSNCCENFPMGLMGHVLSVEKTGGFIKVVTTEAEIEDCYEEFDLDFDTDVFTSKPEEREVDTVVQSRFTRASVDGSKEVVIRDWAMFRAIQSGQRQKPLTRTELEDIYDRDIDTTATKINEELLFHVDKDDLIGSAIRSVNGKINTIDISVYYVNKTHMHKVVKLKEKREYTCTTTSNGIKLSSIMGVDIVKAVTEKEQVFVAKAVYDWIRHPEKFPKINQKLKGKDDFHPVFEIPLGSLPFGILIRLSPVFSVDFGIYGDVEALWWLSSSRTTTDIVNGKKKVDKNEKIRPPSNQFAFNAFGNFHVGGGGELFIGLGKKVSKNEGIGVGAFLEMTVDFKLNITPVTVGDYTLGSGDEFCSITGNGKVGGKILTGGLFGDIEFIAVPFKWWDGVVWNYNPRLQFDNKFVTVSDEDSEGPYTRQTLAYKFTELGLTAKFFNWTSTHKPVLCVYESDDQPLDKPTEVLYDKSFTSKSTVKEKTRYEFIYKNREGKPIYVIPGVEGSNSDNDITLYTPYKTMVQSDIKPNIEYCIDYDEETKTYDYVYQDFAVETTRNGYKYRWALPFTLRNASAIDDYWEDWGVYNVIHNSYHTVDQRYTSLKNQIHSSGKYMLECTYIGDEDTDLSVESGVYYVVKGITGPPSLYSYKINDSNAREYSYQSYRYLQSDVGNIFLKFRLPLDKHNGLGYPDGFIKKKDSF